MGTGDGNTSMEEFFGEVISTYSRAEAIEDGVLVDLSGKFPDLCKEHYRHPVACTSEVWGIVQAAVNCKRHCNDFEGVVHDILWMSRKAITKVISESVRLFEVLISGADGGPKYTFKICVGPGDAMEPVITIMMPYED